MRSVLSGPKVNDWARALLGRCSFPAPGTAVSCAVSGGPDSFALLVLACAAELEVTAVHVDHQLRLESAAEGDVVAAAASRFGANVVRHTVSVEPGPNLEARARSARQQVLPPGSMTGHTADDQAETVLLNLLRGSGTDGLAGIRPGPTKPLLAVRRADTHRLCAEVGLSPVVDPSNADPVHRRNRVRHELLPLLDTIGDRDVVAVLARQAELIRADADLLARPASDLDPTDAKALAAAPLPFARRAIRRWVAAQTGGYPPDSAAVDRIIAVARGDHEACEISPGWRIRRSAQRLEMLPVEGR
ncbi:MAG: tRNA lysidine(34) synthetase TilS [Acidimicrobiales bacterium]